jgi:hypothetical protein
MEFYAVQGISGNITVYQYGTQKRALRLYYVLLRCMLYVRLLG